MRANEVGMLKNLDSEFLHDFRVAVRRTRSGLTQLKGVFPPSARPSRLGKFSRFLAAR
ncbi:CHAD domain-containing protein, partial [Gemmatimonadota bacterium]